MLFVSTLPHSSAHPEAPACNALHFQVSLASGCSFVGTGDVNLVILVLTGQINSSMTLDLFLKPLETGHTMGPWWAGKAMMTKSCTALTCW